METDVLRWFQLVADGMTVTEVADVYQVSQPGVSRALARLDAEVGAPLLQRSGRVLRMTRAGVVFKRHADALVNELDDGIAAVAQLVDPETGVVTLAFQPSLGTWLVPALVGAFRRDHPGVGFVLESTRDDSGSALLAGGRVDLELTSRRGQGGRARWQKLFTEPLFLAVAPGHRLAASDSVRLAEVASDPFVALRPTWPLRTTVDDLCRAAGFTPSVAFEADDLPTVRGLVAAGLGVAVVPTLGEDPLPPHRPGAVVLLPVEDPGATRDIGIAWSLERRLLPAAQLFLRHVRDSAAGRRDRPATMR